MKSRAQDLYERILAEGALAIDLTLSKKPFPLAMTIMQQLPRGFESNSPQMPLGI